MEGKKELGIFCRQYFQQYNKPYNYYYINIQIFIAVVYNTSTLATLRICNILCIMHINICIIYTYMLWKLSVLLVITYNYVTILKNNFKNILYTYDQFRCILLNFVPTLVLNYGLFFKYFNNYNMYICIYVCYFTLLIIISNNLYITTYYPQYVRRFLIE